MKIKIQLYECYPPDNIKKIGIVDLEGQNAIGFEPPDSLDGSGGWCAKNSFDYKYDNYYKYEFPKLRLNYRLTFYHQENGDEMSELTGMRAYAHLNIPQRIYLSWIFRRSWIQKSENIKWLISIPISIFTALITTLIINNYIN